MPSDDSKEHYKTTELKMNNSEDHRSTSSNTNKTVYYDRVVHEPSLGRIWLCIIILWVGVIFGVLLQESVPFVSAGIILLAFFVAFKIFFNFDSKEDQEQEENENDIRKIQEDSQSSNSTHSFCVDSPKEECSIVQTKEDDNSESSCQSNQTYQAPQKETLEIRGRNTTYCIRKCFAVVDEDGDCVKIFHPNDTDWSIKENWRPFIRVEDEILLGDNCEKRADEFVEEEKIVWGNDYSKVYGFIVCTGIKPLRCFPSVEEAKTYVSEREAPRNRIKTAEEIVRRKEKETAWWWQKQRIENMEIYGTEYPTKDQKDARKIMEDMTSDLRWNYEHYGKYSPDGASAVRSLKKYRDDLAEAESWLRTNPGNTIRQAEVARLKKKVEEYEKKVEGSI